jgi:biotin transport system substrate-specific component
MGPTGGYLVGFLVAASVMGLLADRGFTRSWGGTAATLLLGEVILFGLGIAYLASFVGGEKAFELGLYPFLFPDLIKMSLAALLGRGVIKGASRFANL